MLKSLKIANIALVDRAELQFEKGLSVLSGETGAGKSVIVTALSLALGGRADREFIRAGELKASVEATFDVSTMQGQYKKDFEDYIQDNRFTVQREIRPNGTSKVRINGVASSLARLKELTAPLAEILGQHANQMLMSEENHLLFLDHFAALDDLRDEVASLFGDWEKVAAELRRFRSRRDQSTKDRELLLFQKDEIEKAKITVGEEERLLHEKTILDSSRSLMESASVVERALDHEDGSALTHLRQARGELEKMAAIDDGLDEQLRELVDMDYRLEDLRRLIEQYGSSIPDDPVRLDEINARLDELYQLKRKYGVSESAVLQTLAEINEQIGDHPDTEARIAELQNTAEQTKTAYTEKAVSLTSVRRKAAEYLKKLVTKELTELAIDQGRFEFEFLYEQDPDGIRLDDSTVRAHPHGLESGRFLFSANPGEPLKSLVKTASGGEISRVLLALKAAEKKNVNLHHSLLVFDEVDAGIGGQTANEVARKLKKLATDRQLIIITHLHQIARLADHHYVAVKAPKSDARTLITVKKLEREAVAAELDRMVALPKEA
ncbi:MAG TPA: DNA repair protein RecN [Acidobacteriota bacterium]|nr:DNA repair protein RecN [Acidobacteriota bacterium]